MTYTKTEWFGLPNRTTPITSQRLNNLESQYDAVAADADDVGTPVGSAVNAAIVAVGDARYQKITAQPVAVFIGSSNVSSPSWPEELSTRRGWVCKNYAVGGGAFTGSAGASRYDSQVAAIAADNSYNKANVKYVFIGDAGNDIRATFNVQTAATSVFADLRTMFPTARIICIPALWGIAADNIIPGRIDSIMTRYQELSEAGLSAGVEMVEYSWTWHYDTTAWMKPAEVHYTAAGVTRIVYFVERYLNGAGTDSPIGTKLLTHTGNVTNPGLFNSRVGNRAALRGSFTVGATAIDTQIATLITGCEPIRTLYVPVASNARTVHTLAVFNRQSGGIVRSLSTLPAETYTVNIEYSVF